jgi:hypothetical protein
MRFWASLGHLALILQQAIGTISVSRALPKYLMVFAY